jgi:hypothetical protein
MHAVQSNSLLFFSTSDKKGVVIVSVAKYKDEIKVGSTSVIDLNDPQLKVLCSREVLLPDLHHVA